MYIVEPEFFISIVIFKEAGVKILAEKIRSDCSQILLSYLSASLVQLLPDALASYAVLCAYLFESLPGELLPDNVKLFFLFPVLRL